MKCKVCGGTGTSNTCVNGTFKPCTFCDGTGEYEPFDADVELDKLYPIEQTNEEWFCSLPTEEKARFIADNDGTIQIGDEVDYQNTITKWSEWLKQPHHSKE